MKNQLEIELGSITDSENITALSNPQGYKGLTALHKYWGKKPIECLNFLIDKFTKEGDIVFDPFLGSGLVALESLKRNRNFIGIDINPISIELSKLMTNLPNYDKIKKAIFEIEKDVKDIINLSYLTSCNAVATHFLYKDDILQSVWSIGNKNKRIEHEPTEADLNILAHFDHYKPRNIGEVKFYHNSRINTKVSMTISDLFTSRALYCIDVLIDSINKFEPEIRRALLLVLTSASGQMSKMVFTITNRGITTGKTSQKIEVGSWAIGYWRPSVHFEINVWNCFINKANRLIKAMKLIESNPEVRMSNSLDDFFKSNSNLCLTLGDSKSEIFKIKDNSIDLILTDPPHGDRIPYLELSSMWNAILNLEPLYSDEIVVSNAKDRGKDLKQYNLDMEHVVTNLFRVLKQEGILALIFNATDLKYWDFLFNTDLAKWGISYVGCFPMNYSAASIVQDNRIGALKQDYVLIYCKGSTANIKKIVCDLSSVPGWLLSYPLERS